MKKQPTSNPYRTFKREKTTCQTAIRIFDLTTAWAGVDHIYLQIALGTNNIAYIIQTLAKKSMLK